MTDSDHFGLWAASLALHDGYRVAQRLHEGFCRQVDLGTRDAVLWRQRAAQALQNEAEMGRWER